MIEIYHNNRCSKSRNAIQYLTDKKVVFKIIKYLEDTPTEAELKAIIKKLDITPIDLVRKNEAIWKENFKGKELTNSEVITAMVQNPKLIERPIVITKDKAVIARPTENIDTII